VSFKRISSIENSALTAPFSLLDIEVVVMKSDGNKRPGPDGFSIAFFMEFWYLLKNEVRIWFDQFHGNSCLPKSFLFYFVTLIPKVKSLFSLEDFCPISLLESLYKLLSKVFAATLSKVMSFNHFYS